MTDSRNQLRDQSTRLLSLLNAVTDSEGSIKNITHSAIENVCLYTGWPIGHVYVVRTDKESIASSGRIWYTHTSISPEKILRFKQQSEQTEFTPGQGLIGKVLETKQTVAIGDVTVLPGYLRAESAKANGVHGCFAVPVIDPDTSDVRLILEFFNYEQAVIDEETLALTNFIAKQIALSFIKKNAQNRQKEFITSFKKRVKDSVEGIIASSLDVAGIATDLNQSIAEIEKFAQLTKELLDTSLTEMDLCESGSHRLDAATSNIDTVTDSIQLIAFQTKLLALNAKVEAAHAGEVGKGFGIVANEVQSLSGNITHSTENVSTMVSNITVISKDIQMVVGEPKNLSQQADDGTIKIEEAAKNQAKKVKQMATAAIKLDGEAKNLDVAVNSFLDGLS